VTGVCAARARDGGSVASDRDSERDAEVPHAIVAETTQPFDKVRRSRRALVHRDLLDREPSLLSAAHVGVRTNARR
jgi:hypothetical protein